MDDKFRVRLTCEMGDYMEANWETCKRGHGLLYMTFDCLLCYFHGKPAYSEDPEKLAASKEQVRVHFKEVHEKPAQIDVAVEVDEKEKTVAEESDVVKLTLEEVEFYSSSIPKRAFESVTEDKAIEIGQKNMLVELTKAEYEMWAASEEKKRHDALICPFCAKIMSSDYALRRHILQVHKKLEKFECTLCEQAFCAKVSLGYHLKKMHQVGDTMKCEKCDVSLPDFNTYNIHRALHRNITSVKCEECDANIGKEKYTRHLGEVHGVESHFDPEKVSCKIYPHRCKECNSAYKRKEDLERHERAKHLKQVHSCAECGKMFKYKNSLRRHLKADHRGSGSLDNDQKGKSDKPEESSPAKETMNEENSEFPMQRHHQAKETEISKNDITCNQ